MSDHPLHASSLVLAPCTTASILHPFLPGDDQHLEPALLGSPFSAVLSVPLPVITNKLGYLASIRAENASTFSPSASSFPPKRSGSRSLRSPPALVNPGTHAPNAPARSSLSSSYSRLTRQIPAPTARPRPEQEPPNTSIPPSSSPVFPASFIPGAVHFSTPGSRFNHQQESRSLIRVGLLDYITMPSPRILLALAAIGASVVSGSFFPSRFSCRRSSQPLTRLSTHSPGRRVQVCHHQECRRCQHQLQDRQGRHHLR